MPSSAFSRGALLVAISAAAIAGSACDRLSKRPRSDQEHLVAETTRRATAVADDAIAAFLPKGGSATKPKFSNRRLLEQKENFALVTATVELPSPSGTPVRQEWCTIVKFQPPRGEQALWSWQEGAWNCSKGIDRHAVIVQKGMIGWPEEETTAAPTDSGPRH